jgi:hypothetical protein
VLPPVAAGVDVVRWPEAVRDAEVAAAGAAGESAGSAPAGAAEESAGSVATAAVAGSSGHAGSLGTAPGAPWGRAAGRMAGGRSQQEIYVAEDVNHDNQPRWPAANA